MSMPDMIPCMLKYFKRIIPRTLEKERRSVNIPEQEERAVLMMPMQNIWVSYVKRLMMQKWNTRQQNWEESMQVAVELSLIFRQLTVWM